MQFCGKAFLAFIIGFSLVCLAETKAQDAASAPEQPPASQEAPTSPRELASTSASDYVLNPSDTVEVTVFREPDLTTRIRVGPDGRIQLPLIGDIKVGGLTLSQARDLIRKRYDADYLVNPQIYLSVIGYAQRRFTILGQVQKPGAYLFEDRESLGLLEAVALAGGFTRVADQGKILVKRSKAGKEERIRLNSKKPGTNGASFQVQAGDVITVNEGWF